MEGSLSQVSGARPGAHPLRREVVTHHQRERMLTAVAELVAERGYRAVTVADIVKGAATARLKFYENFSSKQDCFFAAFDAALEEALRRVGEACEGAGEDFPRRVSAGIGALLAFIAAEPARARACIVEAPSLGPEMEGRGGQAREGFAALLKGGREGAGETELPEDIEESVLGGLYWLLYHALLSGEPEKIEELRPELVEFALGPFLGAEAARAAAAE